ncbi:MAG TPA: AAA family ATPase [Solirubrobacterales bacterium]|nr:AAA family ATPase [Solirubrobacterales bacterium]
MGFLSRKKPKAAPVTVEESHPIDEDLQRMEELVPEHGGARSAGPVADMDPSSSQAAGETPDPAPPAGEAYAGDEDDSFGAEAEGEDIEGGQVQTIQDEYAADEVEAGFAEVEEEKEAEEDDGRMKASDLIAPSRNDFIAEQQAETEAPVKHADVIAFANQKGGVAKTTTTLNLAVALAESGHRVLCIDLDPQGNLTMSQGIDPDKVETSLYDVLVNDVPISEIIVKREIDIAVASIDLAGAEIAMSTKIGRERSLEKALKEVDGEYDFVCIDTPPSLGLLTINALTAANKVIVPVQCEYLSMRGLVQLQNTLRMIQENLNPDVHIEGILPTMLDSRTVHAKEAVEILEENFGDLVFRSRIRKAIKFAEAPVKGSSVLKYDSGSSAANYYRELAKEVLANGSA